MTCFRSEVRRRLTPELEPSELDLLRTELAKAIIVPGTCKSARKSFSSFIFPSYFIKRLFKGLEWYKKYFVSVQCALDRLKAEFLSYRSAVQSKLIFIRFYASGGGSTPGRGCHSPSCSHPRAEKAANPDIVESEQIAEHVV
ncbi:hypothetical protein RF11_03230 [Thelohanellus kitauei]|uniref:Uncharacterized protein n=1 Tax=Thelohanellus kitauei TaxID=669202 RepID=A0A0C2MIK5_THEKT|nr:hypothetical protein RF11_03230 [Thelohanellus kitauei]